MNKLTADNRFFPLPFRFDAGKLLADLVICELEHWKSHFNTNDYEGEWTGISLRSASGAADDIHTIAPISFTDTPLLSNCPYFREILHQWKCEIEGVRLLALAPGSIIKEHRDPGLGYEHGRFRVHIPVVTDPNVLFVVDDCPLHMDNGECWYANFSLPHQVEHRGTTRRIHLVIDGVRNEWTDRLFSEAGYDFEAELNHKAYDPATKSAMMHHLQLMDSEGAKNILASLKSDASWRLDAKNHKHNISSFAPDSNWIPVALDGSPGEPLVKWLKAGNALFSEPFFHQTLGRIKRSEVNRRHRNVTSSIGQLLTRAHLLDEKVPAALIFHTSRCGSTLLSQMLCTIEHNLVLAEVPLLDAILRLPYKNPGLDLNQTEPIYPAAVRLLAHSRPNAVRNLVVKTDSWHIFFYDTLRQLYPNTPFILMYRQPEQILASHQKQRGLQSIPGYLESSFTGILVEPSAYADLDGFFVRFLTAVFSRFIDIKSKDHNTFFINYNQGPETMLHAFMQCTGLHFSTEEYNAMVARARFDAKRPTEVFSTDSKSTEAPTSIKELLKLYDQLEKM